MSRYDNEPYEMYPDNCERCAGIHGGVRGNENRHPEGDGYRVLCDYCSCEVDGTPEKRELACQDCTLPLSAHIFMRTEHIEAIWGAGINLEICRNRLDFQSITNWSLVSLGEQGPENPCDEEFMKEISS